jgi:hypothetical protein
MVQVEGVTYRVERPEPHCYAVYRLLDDVMVGTFRTRPGLRIHPVECDVTVFRDIVRAALRTARTSAVMHAAPIYQPDNDVASAGPESAAAQVKSPSTVPPRPAVA